MSTGLGASVIGGRICRSVRYDYCVSLKLFTMFDDHLMKRWLPLLLWMGAIYLVSAQPSDSLPNIGAWDLLVKKGAHFTAYAVLAVLACRVSRGWKRPFLWAFLIAVLYAATDEFHQTFVLGRNGNIWDVMIDTSGVLFGLCTYKLWQIRQKPKQFPKPLSDRP